MCHYLSNLKSIYILKLAISHLRIDTTIQPTQGQNWAYKMFNAAFFIKAKYWGQSKDCLNRFDN